MRYSFTLFCLLVSAILFELIEAHPTKPKLPVCIVGAGPAGLTAANRLEKKGLKAVLFEKQPEIGGKCQSYYDEKGIFHPLGAAFYSNATYPETLKVINATGVLSEPFALAGSREQFRFNATTGVIEPLPGLSNPFLLQLFTEIPRYAVLWQKVFAPLSVPSFKKGVPTELTVPGVEWFHNNNFTALPILLVNPLALYGYGDIRVVPALYILQYITPDILTAFIGQHNVYYTDFHKVWLQWAQKSIKSPVYTNTEVTCIERSGSNPVIRYHQQYGHFRKWGHQDCSSIIMAFPPTLHNLKKSGLDYTEDEEEVFGAVGVHNYFSSAVNLKLPFGVSYIANSTSPTVPPPNEGEPVAVLRLSPNSTISTSWSWGPYREFESKKAAHDLLKTTLSKINKDPRDVSAMSVPLNKDDVRVFRKWDYFPHFDSEQLKCGWYEKLNKLQGCKKTYWASGLNGMETVEWAIRAGIDVVDSYF
ncbi:FAD/NAD(P)-binding domain-containing protein [Lindgomyces ingoldianus]|uniref:FAD/NAD(P)-binding domain-containing protein n=1 Tax=Lindgomyces ingoldianus TaxID=673940 RepID=A0ACB6RH19_9PLEO|nr:FAD/NAD(P)-binding domain-containing protein [Lindgomyces ingoldianus]KAF2477635.1 FAD/NAD(P)-binding domain-containing protein [Lindgomyces ingoldianus]